MWSMAWRKNGGLPEFLRSQSGAFGQVLKLCPDDAGMNFLFGGGKGGETAVAATHNVFLADDIGKPDQALGNELGMFDKRRGVGNDAGNDGFAFRHLDVLPNLPLVLVAWDAGLKEIRPSIHLEHDIDDVRKVHLMHSRTNVDAIAGMETYAILRQSLERVNEGFYSQLGPLAAIGHAEVRL